MWNYVRLHSDNSPMAEILSQCSDKSNLRLVIYHLSENHVECATTPNADREYKLTNDEARAISNDARSGAHAVLAFDVRTNNVYLIDSTPELQIASAVLLCVVTELLNGCVQPRQSQCGRPEASKDCTRFAPRPSLEQVAENNYRAMQQFEQEVARRDANGRFAPKHPQMRKEEAPRREVSPFESKSTDELVKIIRERLWDSEINLNRASKEELVAFLDEKNKRMTEYKRMKALEEDPKVNEFKSKMKNTLHNNPHLREWAKKFLGELVDSE